MVGRFGFFMLCLTLSAQIFAQDIQLPTPRKTGGLPLMEALNARQTGRDFSSKPLDEQMLSDLLWAALGINRPDGKRTAPSARNMQEIDLYVALPSGLYLYEAKQNVLEQIFSDDIREQTGKQPFTQRAPVNLIYVAETKRMRGDTTFYSAVDTGYISQNVYLFCASEGLNTVVLGMVDKDALHKAMKLKPSQLVILTQPVGFPPEPAAAPVAKVWKDGVYPGKAGGYAGAVRVAVTIEKGEIADVEVTGQRETHPRKAIYEIPRRIVRANSPVVDAVSGATITSDAIIGAVQNALAEAL